MKHTIAAAAALALLLAGCGSKPVALPPTDVIAEPVQAVSANAPLTATPLATNSLASAPVSTATGSAAVSGSATADPTTGSSPAGSMASSSYNMKEHVIYSGPRSVKKVALTFDDGPDSKYTAQILDILQSHQVKATFFVTGEHAAAHKETMKRIVKEGHEIGNHSWGHADLTKLDEQQLKDEIDKTDETIRGYTGHAPTLLRPPYGAVSMQVVDYAEKLHKVVCWSVDTRDWDGVTAERIMETVKKEVKPGAIILQHSAGGRKGNLSNTVKALPQIIEYLKEHGYQLVTVSELLP